MGWVRLLVIGIENARHSWPWGITGQKRIGTLPAIAVRGADGAHFVVIEHHRSVRYIDDKRIRCIP